jgi:hypothetical protein
MLPDWIGITANGAGSREKICAKTLKGMNPTVCAFDAPGGASQEEE